MAMFHNVCHYNHANNFTKTNETNIDAKAAINQRQLGVHPSNMQSAAHRLHLKPLDNNIAMVIQAYIVKHMRLRTWTYVAKWRVEIRE